MTAAPDLETVAGISDIQADAFAEDPGGPLTPVEKALLRQLRVEDDFIEQMADSERIAFREELTGLAEDLREASRLYEMAFNHTDRCVKWLSKLGIPPWHKDQLKWCLKDCGAARGVRRTKLAKARTATSIKPAASEATDQPGDPALTLQGEPA